MKLDLMVFAICLAFGLVLTVLGFKNEWLSMFGILFSVVVFVDVYLNGLSMVAGVDGASAVDYAVGVDTAIWIPMIMIFLNSLMFYYGRRG